MKRSFVMLILASLYSVSALAAGEKDSAVIQTPDGSKVEVRVPKAAVKEVKQTGTNTYEVKVDRSEMKKIEIKIDPPSK